MGGKSNSIFTSLLRLPAYASDDIESLCYCLAYLALGGLPWESKPEDHVVRTKRSMLTGGCDVLAAFGLADPLGGDAKPSGVAVALRGLWAEVMRCSQGRSVVDYGACFEALGDSSEDQPFDWE